MPWGNLKRFLAKFFRQPLYAFGVGLRRLRANIYYLFKNGVSSPPESITLFLTHRCNLHCKMCGQWGEGQITRKNSAQFLKEELSFSVLKPIIDDFSSFMPNITLFGGEPLLHPDCLETIKYIKQKGLHCLMITNGYFLESFADEIVASGLDELNVSLDGDLATHDLIRGMPGLFFKVVSGIKQINYFKNKDHKHKPLVNLQCTINKYNYKTLEQLLSVASEVKANSLTFHNLIFLKSENIATQKESDRLLNCSSGDWEGFVFNPEIDTKLLFEKMQQILSGKYSFSVDFYPNFSKNALKSYYNDPSYTPLEYPVRCLSPWVSAYIFPDGEVRPCLNLDYSFGNIKNNRFSLLWNNTRAILFRKLLKNKKIFPACIRCTELYRY